MTEVDGSLILSILQKMQGDVAEIKQEVRDLNVRVGIMGSHMRGLIAAQQLTNERLDRLDVRIERIERRLDLVDAH
ncbi:hypothetical protein IP88_16145 [alpha proteobacterium AAP81b]|nr:hypothetical protein IP88_16145 [alpha proteobacterium AAP81b]